jgi:hypothetical protein
MWKHYVHSTICYNYSLIFQDSNKKKRTKAIEARRRGAKEAPRKFLGILLLFFQSSIEYSLEFLQFSTNINSAASMCQAQCETPGIQHKTRQA